MSAKFAKVDKGDIERLLAGITFENFDEVKAEVERLLGALAAEQGSATTASLAGYMQVSKEDLLAMTEQVNELAIEWAGKNAAAKVTAIEETTREDMRVLLERGVADGLSNDELAAEVRDAFGFSDERAMLIARTETSFAENRGTMIAFRESGVVVGKEWLPDAEACPICEANGAQGPIDLDEDFESGDDAPPAHPNCECNVLSVLDPDILGGGAEDAG